VRQRLVSSYARFAAKILTVVKEFLHFLCSLRRISLGEQLIHMRSRCIRMRAALPRSSACRRLCSSLLCAAAGPAAWMGLLLACLLSAYDQSRGRGVSAWERRCLDRLPVADSAAVCFARLLDRQRGWVWYSRVCCLWANTMLHKLQKYIWRVAYMRDSLWWASSSASRARRNSPRCGLHREFLAVWNRFWWVWWW